VAAVQTSAGTLQKRSLPRKPAATELNLQGQRLGRKGRDTRDRIVAAASECLAQDDDNAFTLSAVARKAGLGMTSLYVYFADLTELLLAVLEPVMASAEETYLGHLRTRWPDDALGAHCREFVRDYYRFWQKHTRVLHLRNSQSEGGSDVRMARYRVQSGLPMLQLLVAQMDGDPADITTPAYGMATALFTGIDRLVAVRTSIQWTIPADTAFNPDLGNQLGAEARLLELAIADMRQTGSD
jgi:AcrR family transcriptional regulator